MPEMKKKAKKPAATPAPVVPPTPPPDPAPTPSASANGAVDTREVRYPELQMVEYSTASKRGPLTIEDMKVLLDWETEKEFQARQVEANPGSKPTEWLYGDEFHCKAIDGQKVRCHNNGNNRPFDLDWCQALMHTILNGQWAGPHTIPGETVNCETIRISRYADVVSGSHQMTAAVLADEWLQQTRAQIGRTAADLKYPAWAKEDHVFLETFVATGMSFDPRVLMTIDYVKPRTAADVFYTSDIFRSATSTDRRLLCRILSQAVDVLWTRTDTKGYRTHPELVAFLERHKTLLECVQSIYKLDSAKADRKLTRLRLQTGTCAALLFLQGSSGPKTDGDVYRNEEPPTERNLDWSMWDRSEEFWVLLASHPDFSLVRRALGRLVDSTPSNDRNLGLGGRVPEKLALLSKAWGRWKEYDGHGEVFADSDLVAPDGCLSLSYSNLDSKGNRLPDDQVMLIDQADFEGIDCPESDGKGRTSKGTPMPPAPTREEIEKATQEAIERRRKNTAGKS